MEAGNAIGTAILVLIFVIPAIIIMVILLVAVLRLSKRSRIKRAALVQQEARAAAEDAAERLRIQQELGTGEVATTLVADTTKFRKGMLGTFKD